MVLELVASRLIARYLGSSLYTWTAVIGVVLAGITIGNYAGGRLADRFQAARVLGLIFVLCSISCVCITWLNDFAGTMAVLFPLTLPVRIFSHIAIVFLVPSVLLGTISPLVAKMALDKGHQPGNTIGDIYACGAAGSIAGTFVAGYYLIGILGSIAIVRVVAGVLLLLGISFVLARKKLSDDIIGKTIEKEATRKSTASSLMPMTWFCITVFLSSACIMILEMVASRMAARQLGSSLYTWTSIIGVVLTGITIGNYFGGRLADRFAPRKVVALLFMFSSISCLLIIILNDLIGLNQWEALFYLNWPTRVFLHISMIYLLPSLLLGMISPVVAKMALDLGRKTGSTVGDIYAWGAAGSIAGTFIAGYYLIATIGTIAIIWSVAGLLILIGLFYRPRQVSGYVWLVLFGFAACIGCLPKDSLEGKGTFGKGLHDFAVKLSLRQPRPTGVLYEDETPYCYVAVRRIQAKPEKLAFYQDKLVHSHLLVDDISKLQYAYEQIHAAITQRFSPKGSKKISTLTIGGGGYVYPRYLETFWPGSRVDVAEIDPGVTKAAMEAFELPKDTTIQTYTMDARNFIDELIKKQANGQEISKYDFIYEDALNDYSVPFQLTTKEFNDKIAKLLTDDGIYMTEIIEVYESGRFLSTFVNTLEKTFAYVQVVAEDGPEVARTTFVVVASQRKLNLENLNHEEPARDLKLTLLSEEKLAQLKAKTNGAILTDDFAPVDNMMAPVVRRSAIDLLTQKYINEALEFYENKQFDKSLSRYTKLLDINPEMTKVFAYEKMGVLLAELGRLQESVDSFNKAIQFNEQAILKNDLSNVYKCLGIALARQGKLSEATGPLKKAVEGFTQKGKDSPKSLQVCENLAGSLTALAQINEAMENAEEAKAAHKSAIRIYSKAAGLDPVNVNYHVETIKAYLSIGESGKAIEVLDNAVTIMLKYKQKDQAEALRQFRKNILQQL
jgi:spermidine synthase/predicted MFS family arabinose efflux permease